MTVEKHAEILDRVDIDEVRRRICRLRGLRNMLITVAGDPISFAIFFGSVVNGACEIHKIEGIYNALREYIDELGIRISNLERMVKEYEKKDEEVKNDE